MKKIIPFTKDIKFNTKIYEITSISLENSLVVDDKNEIDGEFIVSGEYKMNDSSINTEPFIYGLPFNISLDDNYETDTIKLDIDDFKYEIINEEILRVNIDVLIDGKIKIINELEDDKEEQVSIEPDVIIDARKEIDSDFDIKEYNDLNDSEACDMKEEISDLFKEEKEDSTKVFDQNNKVTSIFDNFEKTDENYVSYYVHIVRENDNIDSICKKYNVNPNDINEYNNIDQITLGNKIIIPYIDNERI